MAVKRRKSKGFLLTRQEMGEALQVRPEHFDKTFRSLIPAQLIVMDGRRVKFKASAVRAILDGMLAQEREKAKPIDADPLLAGGDSPALEEYRRLRAEMVRRDLAERDRDLMPADQAEDIANILNRRVRACGEQLVLRFGNEAQEILDEALDDAEREIETKYGGTATTT